LEEDGIVVQNTDISCGECDLAPSIAKLSDGEKGLGRKCRDNVSDPGCKRKARDIQLGFVGGRHGLAIGVLDGDGCCSKIAVNDRGVDRKEV
jgi:hypothetical protein